MCGGYKNGRGVEPPEALDLDPLLVQVQEEGVGQIVGEEGAADGIAGVLEGVERAGVQEPFEDVEEVLRARGYDDAGRGRADAPGVPQVGCDALPQGVEAPGAALREQVPAFGREHLPEDFLPDGVGKEGIVDAIVGKIVPVFFGGRPLGVCGAAPPEPYQPVYFLHEVARPLGRPDVALDLQLIVGVVDRVDADPQVPGHRPYRGQLFPRGELPRNDPVLDVLVKPQIKGEIGPSRRHVNLCIHKNILICICWWGQYSRYNAGANAASGEQRE